MSENIAKPTQDESMEENEKQGKAQWDVNVFYACSGHFEDYSISSSPQCYSAASKIDLSKIPFAFPKSDYAESMLSQDFPNYMVNTESSRAKGRSQSAPKSRHADSFERQLPSTRQRSSIEGRNIPRGTKMQRSSSHVGMAAKNYQFSWVLKLDRSTVSLKESECGSTTSIVLTATTYCKSLAAYDEIGTDGFKLGRKFSCC